MHQRTAESVAVVHGEQEVFRRTAHLFANATEIACATNHLATWGWSNGPEGTPVAELTRRNGARIRKVYRSGILLDPTWAQRLEVVQTHPAVQVRVTTDELNETVIIDGRLVILAGDRRAGERTYSLITDRAAVLGVTSLFEAAWRSATDHALFDAQIAEIRGLAPQVLDLLAQGVKDEAAARILGLGVRTYRRRVAELMTALGAESRFQAGVRAREIGLV